MDTWCIFIGSEFSVFESDSTEPPPLNGSGASQPTLSRFYRSVSSVSDTSNDVEADELETTANDWDRSPSPVQQQPPVFYLGHPFSDDGASAAETKTFVQRADTSSSKPNTSTSAEFRNLLKMMFKREGPGCVPDDRPAHHGSLGNFVVPKGSFGSAVLPHVSSFG